MRRESAEAVFTRQVQVNQEKVCGHTAGLVFEFFGTAEGHHIVAFGPQGVGSEFTQVVVVLDQDDAQLGSHSSKQIWVSVGK